MVTKTQITDESYRLELNYRNNQPAPLTKLVAARRDKAAFQLILQSDMHYSVSIDRGEWFSDFARIFVGRHTEGHERLRVAVDSPFKTSVHLEGFMADDDESKKTDILLNQNVLEQYANTPTAVWIEVDVPADAVPGDYTVNVTVYSSGYCKDESVVASYSVPLKVSAYLLADSRDWNFYLDLWQHNCNIARKSDVHLWSDEHFEVIKEYAKSLADLGQKSITICVSEIPWGGQDCYRDSLYRGNLFEYSCIQITKKKDGSFVYDYSAMQKCIDIFTDEGVCGDIEVFGLVNVWRLKGLMEDILCPDYPENIKLRYLDEADGCQKYVTDAEVIKDYIRSLEQYFIKTGQIGRVRIAADEPSDVEKYRESINMLKELAPSFKGKCAINHAEFIGEFHDRIDDFVPYIRCTAKEYDKLMEARKTYPDKKFLWYVCCGRVVCPNTFISSNPIESRIIGLMTSYLRLDGFLRWSYTIWPDDPRRDIRHSNFEAGDTGFVYPAANGKPLLSLRYKNLQRGIADYELIEAYRKKEGDAAADALLKRVILFNDISEYRKDDKWHPADEIFSLAWSDYNNIKEEILDALCK